MIRPLATFARSLNDDSLLLVWTVIEGALSFCFVRPILGLQYWFVGFTPAGNSIAKMLLRPCTTASPQTRWVALLSLHVARPPI